MEKLLCVEDRFLISGRGVVLVPDFPLPPKGQFDVFTEPVVIVKPDGSRVECKASFQAMHSRLLDGTSKWAIVVLLPDVNKEDIPVGSEVYCSEETCALVGGKAV